VRLHLAQEAVPKDEDVDSALEHGDYAAIYRRYGCTPFWDVTYTSPYFHDRRW
jgi:hypothetical protein